MVKEKLLTEELLGQFSDGYWENSRNNSWRIIDGVRQGSNRVVRTSGYFKPYGVVNPTLLKYIGTRMWLIASLTNFAVINTLSQDELDALNIIAGNGWCEQLPRSKKREN